MGDSVNVLLTFPLGPELVQQIEAVDPRLRVRELGEGARRLVFGRPRYPSELEAQTAKQEFEEAMAEAEVLFGFWGPTLIELYPTPEVLRQHAPKLRWIQLTSAGMDRASDVCDELLPSSELPTLLAESDFVVLAVPLTKETRHLIGDTELRAMKSNAVLINIARGAIVDEPALLRALKEGWIAGAALDVFEQEPLPPESELWDMPNVIVSPHISGGTEIYNQRAAGIFCENLRRYLAGEKLMNLAVPARGY